MSGSIKWFVYTTDSGDEYGIRMDESNGEAVGNTDYSTTSTAMMALPRNIVPRQAVYTSIDGNYTRRIPVTSNSATSATLPATITAQVAGSATGVELSLSLFIGERFSALPIAADTGLNDGDAT